MNREEYLLEIVAEEAAEIGEVVSRIGVRVSKILRFGGNEVMKGQFKNNFERLTDEINDLIGIVEFLEEEEVLTNVLDRGKIEAKKEKIRFWAKHSEEQGTLQ